MMMMMNNGPSPILSEAGPVMIIGSTGFIGRFVTEACIDSGRLTYLLVRPRGLTSPPASKSSVLNSFKEKGANIIHVLLIYIFNSLINYVTIYIYHINAILLSVYIHQGSINDQDFMVKVLREYGIEVVISAVGGESTNDQLTLVEAIRAAGTVKVTPCLFFFFFVDTYIYKMKMEVVGN